MMPVLIPAAGASSRMRGADKLMMDIDGEPLLHRQVSIARAVSADVRVALPSRPHPRYAAVRDLDVRTFEVSQAAEGISASLRVLFASLAAAHTHAMVLLPDLPDLTKNDLGAVIDATRQYPKAMIWRGATQSGKGGHPIIVAHPLFKDFQCLTGDSGGNSVIKKLGQAVHFVPLDGNRARQDLDTPEEWAAWRAGRAISDDPR